MTWRKRLITLTNLKIWIAFLQIKKYLKNGVSKISPFIQIGQEHEWKLKKVASPLSHL